jgi:hypothetical protein
VVQPFRPALRHDRFAHVSRSSPVSTCGAGSLGPPGYKSDTSEVPGCQIWALGLRSMSEMGSPGSLGRRFKSSQSDQSRFIRTMIRVDRRKVEQQRWRREIDAIFVVFEQAFQGA